MALELSLSTEARAQRDDVYDTVIIGGGPAGLSAALYAARAKLRTVVLDMNPRAGALAATSLIVNYPGVPEELSGAQLLERFRRQAESFGAEIVQAQVLSTDLASDPKLVFASTGVYKARTVIIASGALGRKASIPGEAEFLGKGVSYCAPCDAAFFQDKEVAVIGNSEAMPDELAVIARFARTIYLIPRGRLTEEQAARVAEFANVRLMESARPVRIVGERTVTGVELDVGGETESLPVSGVFVYLKGNRPMTSFVDASVKLNEDGCIEVDPRDHSTSQPGVYAVGDVVCSEARQAVIAAAQGALAGLAVDKYVRQAKRIRQQWN